MSRVQPIDEWRGFRRGKCLRVRNHESVLILGIVHLFQNDVEHIPL